MARTVLAVAAAAMAAFLVRSTRADLPPCVMPAGGKITIGDKAYLCITINGKSRALFAPVADKYSAFRLASSELPQPRYVSGAHRPPRGDRLPGSAPPNVCPR